MASPKLTHAIRSQIIANVMKTAFVKEQAAIDARLLAFCDNLYLAIVPTAVQEALAKVPKEFLMRQSSCKVTLRPVAGKYDGSREVVIKFADHKDRPWPVGFNYGSGSYASPELCDIHDGILKAQEKLNERKDTLRDNVRQIVASATTVAKLLAVWPEAAQFIPTDLAPKPKVNLLPAVLVGNLNAMIKKAGVDPFPAPVVA